MPKLQLTLPSIVDIAACSNLQHMLLDSLSTHRKVVVDAGAIERVSTPGIQLFISASKSAQSIGKELTLAQSSSVFSMAIEDLGLTDIFRVFTITGEKAP